MKNDNCSRLARITKIIGYKESAKQVIYHAFTELLGHSRNRSRGFNQYMYYWCLLPLHDSDLIYSEMRGLQGGNK